MYVVRMGDRKGAYRVWWGDLREGDHLKDLDVHGRTYFHRFKITDDPTCLCKMSPQTTDHLLWECDLLKKQRQVLRNSITKTGGNWPITNSDLANKYTKFFQRFVNTINFESL